MISAVSIGQSLKIPLPLPPCLGPRLYFKRRIVWITGFLRMISWLIIASLTLPACTSSQTKSRPTDFYSALCPRPVASFRREFSGADRAFFRFLGALAPDRPNSILIISEPYEPKDFIQGSRRLHPGGFLLFNGDFGVVMQYLKPRYWERLPFTFRDYHIYRKPLEFSA